MSLDKMIEKIAALQNPTVAGLDPKLDYIPQYLREEAYARHGRTLEGAAAAILAYNKGLIDALCGIVPAVKPQAAYYEMYGWQGVRTLYETIRYAHEKGMYVILDGKRNDIGATMESYAAAWLGLTAVENELAEPFGADSLTVNGYLGSDGINPLLKVCGEQGRGIFVLVKTSNPSSGELQDQKLQNPRRVVIGRLHLPVGLAAQQHGLRAEAVRQPPRLRKALVGRKRRDAAERGKVL